MSDMSNQPMRVEVIRGLGLGGAERLLVDRLAAEKARYGSTGADIVVVNVAPRQNALENELRRQGRRVHHPRFGGRWAGIFSSAPFFATLPPGTLVVCHSPAPAVMLKLLKMVPFAHPFKLVDVVHSTQFHKGYGLLRKLMAGQADATVAVSDDVLQSLQGWGSKRLSIVHGGVPRQEMLRWLEEHHAHPIEMRTSLGLEGSATVLSFIANLRPAKNHDLVLDVARKLGSNVNVLLIGEGPERGRLEARIREEDIGNVRLLGQQPSAWRFAASSNAVLHLSHWEGLPVALMEAAALGVPIVTNDFPGAREMARMTPGLECVESNSADELAQVCRRVVATAPSPSDRISQLTGLDNYWDLRRYVGEFDRVFLEVSGP